VSLCQENVFQQIHADWNQSVQRFLSSRGLSAADAADLCQEAFVRLWNQCAKVDPERAGAYLFQVARNLSIDHFRKAKTRLKYQGTICDRTVVEDGQYRMEMNEFKEKLETAIDTMTAASKEVFVMHRFDSKTYKEIAELLGISVKAVEKRMHKALLHLSNQKIFLRR